LDQDVFVLVLYGWIPVQEAGHEEQDGVDPEDLKGQVDEVVQRAHEEVEVGQAQD
jgi:hypothetical protein